MIIYDVNLCSCSNDKQRKCMKIGFENSRPVRGGAIGPEAVRARTFLAQCGHHATSPRALLLRVSKATVMASAERIFGRLSTKIYEFADPSNPTVLTNLPVCVCICAQTLSLN